MVSINVGKHDQVTPEVIQFLIDRGQIFQTLIGYDWTEAGKRSCTESAEEHTKQKNDVKTGPSGKGDFYKVKRTAFSENDDLSIPPKRRSSDSMANMKPKPVTKYK